MKRENLIEQKSIGEYRISIFRDEFPLCPVTDFTLCGVYIWEFCEYGGMRLSSYSETDDLSCDPHSLEDALRELVCRYVSQKDIIRYIDEQCHSLGFVYNKSDRIYELFAYDDRTGRRVSEYSLLDLHPDEYHGSDCIEEICDNLSEDDFKFLLENCQDEIAYMEWGSTGYSQGDYAEGIAYCDIERFRENVDTDTSNWRARAVEHMEAEAEMIGKWMWGDVYEYTLEKKEVYIKKYINPQKENGFGEEYETIDSCGGFYCEPDELVKKVLEEHNLFPKSAA